MTDTLYPVPSLPYSPAPPLPSFWFQLRLPWVTALLPSPSSPGWCGFQLLKSWIAPLLILYLLILDGLYYFCFFTKLVG